MSERPSEFLIVLIFLWFYDCVHHCGTIEVLYKYVFPPGLGDLMACREQQPLETRTSLPFFVPCLVIGQWQHVRSLFKCEVVIQSGSNLNNCNNVYLFYSFVLTSRFQYYPSGCSHNFRQPSLCLLCVNTKKTSAWNRSETDVTAVDLNMK
jgi:hypothetical protein